MKVEKRRKMYVIFFFFPQGAFGTPPHSLPVDPAFLAGNNGGCSSLAGAGPPALPTRL